MPYEAMSLKESGITQPLKGAFILSNEERRPKVKMAPAKTHRGQIDKVLEVLPSKKTDMHDLETLYLVGESYHE
jgi:hypothetical protein